MTKRQQLSDMLSWLEYLVLIGADVADRCDKEWKEMHRLFLDRYHPYSTMENRYCLNGDSTITTRLWEYCFKPELAHNELVGKAILEIHRLTNSDYPNGFKYYPPLAK